MTNILFSTYICTTFAVIVDSNMPIYIEHHLLMTILLIASFDKCFSL